MWNIYFYMYKSSVIDIEHYLIILQYSIKPPSELVRIINFYDIYVHMYIYCH